MKKKKNIDEMVQNMKHKKNIGSASTISMALLILAGWRENERNKCKGIK